MFIIADDQTTAYVAQVISNLAKPKPGWEFASWTEDPRYNDPPGACPDDQPPAGYRGLLVPGANAKSA